MRLWHNHREPGSETARQGTVMKGVIAILLAGCPISTSFAQDLRWPREKSNAGSKKDQCRETT